MVQLVDVRHEQVDDQQAVRELLLAAFGDHGLVANLVDSLSSIVTAGHGSSLVAAESDKIVGQVMFTSSLLDAPASWSTFRCSARWLCYPSGRARASGRRWSAEACR
jgi:predicted N-acetyltransferase YhbS